MIDTNALLWFVEGSERLGRKARALINDEIADGSILIPAILAWEVAQLAVRNRITLTQSTNVWFRTVLAQPAFRIAPLELDIAIATAELDWPHRDPVDRFVVATAQHHRAALLTADRAILAYAEAGHLRAIDASR